MAAIVTNIADVHTDGCQACLSCSIYCILVIPTCNTIDHNRSVTAQVVASQLVTNNFTSTLRSASSGWRRVVFGRVDSGEVCACQCRLCWSKFVSFEWGLIDVYLIQCLCIVLMFMIRHDVNIHRVRAVMWSDHPSLYQEAQSAVWGLEDQRILWQWQYILTYPDSWTMFSPHTKVCSLRCWDKIVADLYVLEDLCRGSSIYYMTIKIKMVCFWGFATCC